MHIVSPAQTNQIMMMDDEEIEMMPFPPTKLTNDRPSHTPHHPLRAINITNK